MNISPKAIQRAREILKKVKVIENNSIKNEYRGYIASFGASIAQSGLVPSVAFFENKNTNAQQDKYKIMKAILLMIKDEKEQYETLLDYLLDKQNTLDSLQDKVISSATALKLAMNTFEKEKDKSDEKSQ